MPYKRIGPEKIKEMDTLLKIKERASAKPEPVGHEFLDGRSVPGALDRLRKKDGWGKRAELSMDMHRITSEDNVSNMLEVEALILKNWKVTSVVWKYNITGSKRRSRNPSEIKWNVPFESYTYTESEEFATGGHTESLTDILNTFTGFIDQEMKANRLTGGSILVNSAKIRTQSGNVYCVELYTKSKGKGEDTQGILVGAHGNLKGRKLSFPVSLMFTRAEIARPSGRTDVVPLMSEVQNDVDAAIWEFIGKDLSIPGGLKSCKINEKGLTEIETVCKKECP